MAGPRGVCGIPRAPIRTFSMHGGAGAILSLGLLKALSLEHFEDCVYSSYSTGGDALITICLWEVSLFWASLCCWRMLAMFCTQAPKLR